MKTVDDLTWLKAYKWGNLRAKDVYNFQGIIFDGQLHYFVHARKKKTITYVISRRNDLLEWPGLLGLWPGFVTRVWSFYDFEILQGITEGFIEFLEDERCICIVLWRCPWCSRYRRRKWTRRHEFKSWTRLIAFHITLIPLGKVWIQSLSLQLWVNSRTD